MGSFLRGPGGELSRLDWDGLESWQRMLDYSGEGRWAMVDAPHGVRGCMRGWPLQSQYTPPEDAARGWTRGAPPVSRRRGALPSPPRIEETDIAAQEDAIDAAIAAALARGLTVHQVERSIGVGWQRVLRVQAGRSRGRYCGTKRTETQARLWRERQAHAMAAEGMASEAIAERLGVTDKVARAYLRRPAP
jgi:hypothetical protein